MKNRLYTCILLQFVCSHTFAQLSTNEPPISFDKNLTLVVKKKSEVPVAIMPQLDMEAIEKEDKEDEEYDMPPRFGYQHWVDYDLNNSGTWYELPNGDKLWQLNVVCPNALSVNFCYDKFWIPEGGKLFVYSKDKKQSIGAFTNRNNKGDRDNLRGFATGLVYGSDVILEYYQPKEVMTDAIISIDYVVHGYRYVSFEEKYNNDPYECMVNINCEEGQDWQHEKYAVAIIAIGYAVCTGSLITTSDLSGAPLFLTANHCLEGKDAVNDPILDHTFLVWNYERPGCLYYSPPTYYMTSGATVLANDVCSDFALLRLSEDPKEITNYTPFYLGWDCSGESGDPGVCIHHPNSNVKKISTAKIQPYSHFNSGCTGLNQNSLWGVTWKSTLNGHGTTAGGSSGAPLLNAAHKFIGQLRNGRSSCEDLYAADYFGKFDVSWIGDNNSSIYRRLNCWLDSLNTGVQTMEGLMVVQSLRSMTVDEQLYSNIRIINAGQLIIQSNVEMMGNSRVIVEAGGQLIVDSGMLSNVELELKPGASLLIINGGIIETRNGFEAPIGATVDIVYGQIL